MSTNKSWIIWACVTAAASGCNEPPKIPISGSSYRISLSQDGTLYYVSSKSGARKLYACDSRSPEKSRLIEVGEGLKGWPCVAADGSSLVFTTQKTEKDASNICHLDFESGTVTQLTQNDNFDAAPSLNSDGSKIVFIRANLLRDYSMGGKVWNSWDIYTINADGTNEKRMTFEEYYMIAPPFYLDNDTIVFSARVSGNMKLLLLRISKDSKVSEVKRIDSEIGNIQDNFQSEPFPSFSGHSLAFVWSKQKGSPYSYEIWKLSVDENTAHKVTDNGGRNCCPVWSSDGRHIFYLSDPQRDGRFEIRKIDADGTNESVLFEEAVLH